MPAKNPIAQVTLEFSRAAKNSVGTQVGTLVAGSSPPRYEFGWSVRQHQGRWGIKLRDYRSNTVNFKIDKRKQIVEVANRWDGAIKGATGGNKCDDFARYVYGYVGLTIPAPPPNAPQYVTTAPDTVNGLWWGMNTAAPDPAIGAIAFYQFPIDTTHWNHNGVGVGGGEIVDQNCGLFHDMVNPPATIGKHSDQDTGLLAPPQGTGRYKPPTYYSTQELQNLDAE